MKYRLPYARARLPNALPGWPSVPTERSPGSESTASVWFSMDLNVFFFFSHCDYPRGKNSNCRKCLVFLPLMGKKKKPRKWKVNSHEVPRKAVIGPSGRMEGRNGPVGNKEALTGLQTCGQPCADGCWSLLELGMATPTSAPCPSRRVFKGL